MGSILSFRLRTLFSDYSLGLVDSTVRNVCAPAFYLSKFTSIKSSVFNKAFQRFSPSQNFRACFLSTYCPAILFCGHYLITPRKRSKLLLRQDTCLFLMFLLFQFNKRMLDLMPTKLCVKHWGY